MQINSILELRPSGRAQLKVRRSGAPAHDNGFTVASYAVKLISIGRLPEFSKALMLETVVRAISVRAS